MKKLIFTFLFLIHLTIFANDGAYYASGNQLIPITENDVKITKEILTVARKTVDGIEYAYVTVNYTFFNPGVEKKILVGFEAPSPSGDVNGFPKNGAHPYMSNFKVIMNGTTLNFETAMVNSDNYYINNQIDAKTEEEVTGEDFNSNSPEFYYVYHFNAKFNPGKNKIVHTYRFEMSGSISENYSFDYILTAANRWANNQIDDFTLNIDMGLNQGFSVKNSFFDHKNEWQISNGRSIDIEGYTNFINQSDKITFKKKNFHPNGELYVKSLNGPMKSHFMTFDYTYHNLPKKIDLGNTSTNSVNENSFKILRNLPFAIKGYVFKTKLIQDYYLSQNWYIPNPDYKSNLDELYTEERDWLSIVKSKKWDKQ
ncbi:YARHG domain-containing protein [Cellulophaga baltica]|uniref:YARHG domain-containing protein n=1 Tax=Cellulophaga TaxID=104264 RepID=UPI001C065A6F|nr:MULTISPECIES: YARHG domain-containing protein [Cellulophaga]MBU2996445.1 YARHG domain-containing protein [Cellulophaga baltica]MDO6767839.1 YARHG domain-containing protein [Cellulophaga sp. 1_MG-2023]